MKYDQNQPHNFNSVKTLISQKLDEFSRLCLAFMFFNTLVKLRLKTGQIMLLN
jgi:hypothetical protein